MNSPLYYNALRNDGLPHYEDLFPLHSSYLANAYRENRYDNYVDTCRQNRHGNDTRRQNGRDNYVDPHRHHRCDNYVDSMCNAQNSLRQASSKKKIKGLRKAVGAVITAIFG